MQGAHFARIVSPEQGRVKVQISATRLGTTAALSF